MLLISTYPIYSKLNIAKNSYTSSLYQKIINLKIVKAVVKKTVKKIVNITNTKIVKITVKKIVKITIKKIVKEQL
jgi:hypothetical protein